MPLNAKCQTILNSLIYTNDLSSIPALLSTISVWFVPSEIKWLVAGKRYFLCDGVGEVGVLDENGGLTVEERGVGNCIVTN